MEWSESGTCSLRRVMGPDEFHSHVDNNAFTNYLVRWHLETAADVHDELRTEHPEVGGRDARASPTPRWTGGGPSPPRSRYRRSGRTS